MGLTINSTSVSTSSLRVANNSSTSGATGKLSVRSSRSDTASISSVNPEDRARRSATLQLSQLASSINTKQDLTEEQSQTVDSLLATAREIKRETNPLRRNSLATDASGLISSTTSQVSSAIQSDPTLAQTSSVQITVDSEIPVGDSSRQFNLTVSKVSTLSELGVSSSLSFSSSNIDTTISTLEAAQGSLSAKLAGFNSDRTAISQEVSSRGESAGLTSSSGESADAIASRLAKNITSSVDSLLASSKVDRLDISSLISESDDDFGDVPEASASAE